MRFNPGRSTTSRESLADAGRPQEVAAHRGRSRYRSHFHRWTAAHGHDIVTRPLGPGPERLPCSRHLGSDVSLATAILRGKQAYEASGAKASLLRSAGPGIS